MSRREWLDGLRPGDKVLVPHRHPVRLVEHRVEMNGRMYITLAGGLRAVKSDGRLENCPNTPLYASAEAYKTDMKVFAKLHDAAEVIRALTNQRKPESITMAEVEQLQRAVIALGSETMVKREGYGRN